MRLRLGLVMCLVSMLAACGSDGDQTGGSELLVSAAASLTDAFTEIEFAFESEHPNVDVLMNFAGSSTLREQILAGAPVDVFASANRSNMNQLVEAGLSAGEPDIFVNNMLQIAVPSGNPGDVTGLGDFAREELLVGLCAKEVPCGDFARQALSNAGVEPAIDTNEPDIRALLTKIETGELDAGITYVTDVASTDGAVEGVDISDEHNIVAEYPIAIIASAPNAEEAGSFVAFVRSAEGQAILNQYGFSSP